ncbi:hypothetical protein BC567DRAFT_226324 [Phyllosticta citribraziliensis]
MNLSRRLFSFSLSLFSLPWFNFTVTSHPPLSIPLIPYAYTPPFLLFTLPSPSPALLLYDCRNHRHHHGYSTRLTD